MNAAKDCNNSLLYQMAQIHNGRLLCFVATVARMGCFHAKKHGAKRRAVLFTSINIEGNQRKFTRPLLLVLEPLPHFCAP